MTISCPHCATQYQLPPSLMGPGGARVRCPRCQESFVVSASGEVTPVLKAVEALPAPPEPSAPTVAAAPMPSPEEPAPAAEAAKAPAFEVAVPENESPEEVARRLLAEMDAEHGPNEIAFAAQQGTLFFAHGARLMEAWDAYRRIVGRNASATVFRDALRERWGVDLTPADALPR